MDAIPTYAMSLNKFEEKPISHQIIIAASLSATECFLYNEQILPTERDIRIVHQAMQLKDADERHAYLQSFPMYDRFFQCYTPMNVVIRKMANTFQQSNAMQARFAETGDGVAIAKQLFENTVGFPLRWQSEDFAREFANALLKPSLPADFICPPKLSPYSDWSAWMLMEYPKNFIFHQVHISDMPDDEKSLLIDSVREGGGFIEWFHREYWASGKNPVDALTLMC